jgi:AraC family transcriptional regulator
VALPSEHSLTFHTLYESQVVSVRDYQCRASRSGPTAEQPADGHNIVLLRRGVFCKHVGREALTVDVNQTVFFAKGSTYQVSHPTDSGNRGTIFTPTPQVLHDMLREFDPASEDRPGQPFPFGSGPCDSRVFWRHRELLRRLETEPLETLWADETAIEILVDALAAAFTRLGKSPKRRQSTLSDHEARAEAAKAYIARHMGERISLDDVACSVHTSPFHLARIFRRHTGLPVHRYLTRLRLRASLERLADGISDLTTLALELGFSSHSHFTDSFRREFGHSPSEVRSGVGRRKLLELSKNLEA